jgi:hypothetical protein
MIFVYDYMKELHWVIGHVQKISTFDTPAWLSIEGSFYKNLVRKKPEV